LLLLLLFIVINISVIYGEIVITINNITVRDEDKWR